MILLHTEGIDPAEKQCYSWETGSHTAEICTVEKGREKSIAEDLLDGKQDYAVEFVDGDCNSWDYP